LGYCKLAFLVTAINYADRTVLSIAGPALAKSLNLNSVSMGIFFRHLDGHMYLPSFREDGFWTVLDPGKYMQSAFSHGLLLLLLPGLRVFWLVFQPLLYCLF